jgi:hypothetical protein
MPRFARSLGLVGLLCSFGMTVGYYSAKGWSELAEAFY